MGVKDSNDKPTGHWQLTEQERERIRAEEVFREEVRATFRDKTPPTLRNRLWKFLNSSFTIFLLSSVVLGGISWQYQRWISAQARESERSMLREEASLELGYRFVIMADVMKEPTATGRDGLYVRAVFFGQQPYVPAIFRFREVSVPAIMFVLQREKLDDFWEKLITRYMPELSVAMQRLAGFKEEEELDKKDKKLREHILNAVKSLKTLALSW